MLIIPPIKPYRRPARATFGAPSPGQLSILSTEAVYENDELFVRLYVNTTPENPINDLSSADGSKWSARFEGFRHQGAFLVGDEYNRVTVYFTPVEPSAGENEISYTNAPSDVGD